MTEKIRRICRDKEQIASLKESLEKDLEKLEKMQASFESQKEALSETLTQKQAEVANLDQELQAAIAQAAAEEEARRKAAEEAQRKAAEEAAASGSEQTGGNKVTKYAATFLGVLALVGLAAGGSIYAFMQQKQKKQAEKEALDPDANYTEDKGDFEIPVEDEPEKASEEDNVEE